MNISGAEEIFKKISPLIEAQFPAFIREEGPKFVSFLKAYYEFLEQSGNVVTTGRSLIEYQDIDRTIDSFLDYFRKEFMLNIPKDVLADQRLLTKHIRQFYRTRGSEFSYRFLFRALFNKEIDLYYPGDYILRASDGRWAKETLLRVGRPFSALPTVFEGRNLIGLTSGARAKVQGVSQVNVLGIDLYELIIENVVGLFENDEIVQDNLGNTARIQSQFGSIVKAGVLDGGAYHTAGDNITITSGVAIATGRVVSTAPTGGAITFRITRGGSGYRLGNTSIINVIGGSGNGASAIVSSLSNTSTLSLNNDLIGSVRNVVLSTGATFASLGTNSTALSANLAVANISSQLATALNFTNSIVGSINSITLTSVGRGYQTSLPTVVVIDQEIYDRAIPGQNNLFQGGDALIVAENAPGTIDAVSIIASDASFDRFSTASLTNVRGTALTPSSYTDLAGITRYTLRANTYNGVISPEVSGVITLPGRYTDTKGFISWNNKLQDNNFYQEYSYVLRITETINKYRDVVKRVLHPAGTKMFGEFQTISSLPHAGHNIVRTDADTATRMVIFANNLSRLSTNTHFNIGTQELNVSGVEFSPSGRKMYIVGITNDRVYQYNLTAPFDITTAAYASKSFSVANTTAKTSDYGDINPTGIRFKPDGSRMYVIGNTRDNITQYDLGTAWDVSTAYVVLDKFLTHAGDTITTESGDALGDFSTTTTDLSLTELDTGNQGFAFKPDGYKLFVVGEGDRKIVECQLSSAWDVRTASILYDNILFENGDVCVMEDAQHLVLESSSFFYIGNQDLNPNDVQFNIEGTQMFISGSNSDRIYGFALSEAWNVETAVYLNQYIATVGTSPTGITFNPDQTKLFVCDSVQDRIDMFQHNPRILNQDQSALLTQSSEFVIQE